ncbi:uncharacterized protein LOC130936237 isoform X2 [Arachis stenosperma]|uniref:uncharacterized protein LOC130936237 isoform X2 n=1 Tax=Arachis stenosperma TaxID=217475 RepID=UPI0025AD18E2|nr:uncharacterized protein LOC130936237 isoform X2 [Arachis stenosperma]
MESFKVAANFFFQLWNVFAKDVVSATLDLTLLFAEFLHHLFSAQASELELQQQLNNNDDSYALQQHRYAPSFVSVCELYVKAYVLILDVSSAAALKHVYCFDQDQTWITHLLAKRTFFEAEAAACLRQSFSKASVYVPSTFGLLAENLVQSWTPQYLEWRMKTCHVETGPVMSLNNLF